MSDLTISEGETHKIPEGETEVHSNINLEGGLELSGQLNIGGEPEVPPHILWDNLSPERMDLIVRSFANFLSGIVDSHEITGGFPPLFRRLPGTPQRPLVRLR